MPRRVQEALAVRERSLNHQPANDLDWPTPDEDALVQLYRDTQVPIETLQAVEPAMRCFRECLKARTGKDYGADAILDKLRHLARQAVIPPLGSNTRPNGRKPAGKTDNKQGLFPS